MAKVSITESDIQKIVKEAVSKLLSENTIGGWETRRPKAKKMQSKGHKKVRASEIIAWLKEPMTDCAAVAAQLWPNKNDDSRRSYFYKCRDHKSYKAGSKSRTYDFTRNQYMKLYNIMTDMAK